MSRLADAGASRPWYRQAWPWALMLPPLFAVIGGVAMLVLATRTPSPLVVEDYARIEELTAERFARDRLALALGLQATLRLSATGRIELDLRADQAFELPAALILHLRHATRAAADQDVRLVRFGDVYAATATYTPGHYAVELMPEDHSWRLGTAAARLQGEIRLLAQSGG